MQQASGELAKKTLIFAHRGANREAAENTREAFDKSLLSSIDGIETDIQLSRDEVPVLWHDRFTDKLGKPGKHIDDFDLAELETLRFVDLASVSDCAHAGVGKVMSLNAFLLAYRHRCSLLLEIKNRNWETRYRQELKVGKLLEMILPLSKPSITVSSFNLSSLVYAHHCNDQVPLIYNFEDYQTFDDARQVLIQHPFLHGLCLPIASVDEHWIGLLQRHKKTIAVYTCNNEQEIRKALEFQVDIIVSDLPELAIQLRGR
ncbi:MAG: glycerophosphodiester phosphodiesterase [Gallionella sp.]